MSRLVVALLIILVVTVALGWLTADSSGSVMMRTISECKAGESPATHPCYDPSLP